MRVLSLVLLSVVICASVPGGTEETKPLVSAGEFKKIYDPSIGEEKKWYINDHCFIHDGTAWHLFGITHAEPMAPLDEKNFAHATAESLTQSPWNKEPFALTADPKWDEMHLWAPHIIRHDGLYYMYYCAGDKDHTKYKIHLAVSADMKKWRRHPGNPMVVDGYDARDPFVMRVGDKWAMYYTANSEPSGGSHIVACVLSDDLIHWGERKVVFTHEEKGTYGGPTESPFVVRRGEYYYLFIGPSWGYDDTDVFRSKDPFHWTADSKVGHVGAHAPEVVRDLDGKWYVSRCGWGRGGVYLAPLVWNDGLDGEDTSMPAPTPK